MRAHTRHLALAILLALLFIAIATVAARMLR
jgi:hypothetical protein